jgi:hypothetical protein
MRWTRSWNEGGTASCATLMMRTSTFAVNGQVSGWMALLLKLYGRLRLTVHPTKSTVASVFQRKFLGYSFWVASGGRIHRRVADKAKRTFKQRVRELPRRSGGVSLRQWSKSCELMYRDGKRTSVWHKLQRSARAGQMDTPLDASDPTQAVETRHDRLPGTDRARSFQRNCATGSA